MSALRVLLIALLVMVVAYTVPVVLNHGPNLFPTFFGDIGLMGWAGQFNVDFLGFLLLSGTWLAWRHHFSAAGIALGVLGFFGGIPVLTIYLLIQLPRCAGDWSVLFLGEQRAAARTG